MPSDESGGQGNFWYSFDYGLAHFITLDSETDFPVGLQSPDGPTPWNIVNGAAGHYDGLDSLDYSPPYAEVAFDT